MNRQLIALASRTLGDAHHREQQDALSIEGRLRELAFNLWWNWHPQVLEMFRELDHRGWADTNHNPIALLKRFAPGELASRVAEASLENRVSFHYRRLQEYLASDVSWCSAQAGALRVTPIALFLGGVRPARIAAALLGRPRRARRRLPQERVGPRACRWSASASSTRTAISASGSTPTGWQREDYGVTDIENAADEAAGRR